MKQRPRLKIQVTSCSHITFSENPLFNILGSYCLPQTCTIKQTVIKPDINMVKLIIHLKQVSVSIRLFYYANFPIQNCHAWSLEFTLSHCS